MSVLRRRIAVLCMRRGLRVPARTSLYSAFDRMEGRAYLVSELPVHVRAVLYNLAPSSSLPGRQLAFYCVNYGPLTAISFAAGLPWPDLYQARRLRGWRPRSLGLLQSVLRVRGIR